MNDLAAVKQACQEVIRQTVIRYVGFACLIFGLITGIIGETERGQYPGFGFPVMTSGVVLLAAGVAFLVRPPVGGLFIGARLLFVMAGVHLLLWVATIPLLLPFAPAWMIVPFVLAFHGWLALRFRERFGDRAPETTPAPLRRELGRVLRSLVHGKPESSPAYIRFTTVNTAETIWSSYEIWHGWLAPDGYAVFLVFSSHIGFNDTLVSAVLHLRAVRVINRADLILTLTGECHGRMMKLHVGMETEPWAHAITTPASAENYRRWKDAAPT